MIGAGRAILSRFRRVTCGGPGGPKSSDLSIHSPDRLREVEHRLNHRPRKTLSWATPASILTEYMRS